MFHSQRLAQLVELMAPRGLALTGGKQAIGELLAVVRQQTMDLDGTGFVQGFQTRCKLALLVGLMATKTQRVARSIATNRYRRRVSSAI